MTVTTADGTSATSPADQFTYERPRRSPPSARPPARPPAAPRSPSPAPTSPGPPRSSSAAPRPRGFTVVSSTQITATTPGGHRHGRRHRDHRRRHLGHLAGRPVHLRGRRRSPRSARTSARPAAAPRSPSPGPASPAPPRSTFGGTPATAFTVASATQITGHHPGGHRHGRRHGHHAGRHLGHQPAPTSSPTWPPDGHRRQPDLRPGRRRHLGDHHRHRVHRRHRRQLRHHRGHAFTVVSATQITGHHAGRAPGTVDVTVTTAGGHLGHLAADQFTYVAAPTVTAISPTRPDRRRHLGHHHRHRLHRGHRGRVRRPPRPAPSPSTRPPDHRHHARPGAGTVDITVTTPGGTSATSAADQFTYEAAPTVTAVSPTCRPDRRRHLGHHHRHQLHRGHRGQVRHRPRPPLHRQLGHLDHRHHPGRAPARSTSP